MKKRGRPPMPSIKLLHEGKERKITFARQPDGRWTIRIDGELWASGERRGQGSWMVVAGEKRQAGRTLTSAATALFYDSMSGRC